MITSAQYTIDGVAIKIVATAIGHRTAVLNNFGSHPLYVNGADTVTSSTGFYLDKASGPVNVKIAPDEELWAIAGAGTTTTVSVMLTDE